MACGTRPISASQPLPIHAISLVTAWRFIIINAQLVSDKSLQRTAFAARVSTVCLRIAKRQCFASPTDRHKCCDAVAICGRVNEACPGHDSMSVTQFFEPRGVALPPSRATSIPALFVRLIARIGCAFSRYIILIVKITCQQIIIIATSIGKEN